MFDPWTATEEDALEEGKRLLAINVNLSLGLKGNIGWLLRPRLQQATARHITSNRKNIESGGQMSGYLVMDSISQALELGLDIPDWLAANFVTRVKAVTGLQVKSWDAPEAFGSPFPPRMHFEDYRKTIDAMMPVYDEVCRLLNTDKNRPIDQGLFEEITENLPELGLKTTSIKKAYYMAKEGFGDPRNRHT